MAKTRTRKTGGPRRRPKGKTMFFKPKSKTPAGIISIGSPREARGSVRKPKEWAGNDETRVRRAIQSATLAANRVEASTEHKTRELSPQEKREMKQAAEVYRSFTDNASEKLDRLRGS